MGGIALATALAVATPAVVGAENPVMLRLQVVLKTAELRVGDLVELRGARLPARVADMIVLRLPTGESVLDLPAEQAAALVRRRVPSLRPAITPGAVVHVRQGSAPARAAVQGNCFVAVSGIAAGAVLTTADVAKADCQAAPVTRLRYDRAGLVLSGEAMPAGAYLGRLPALPERAVGKGVSLTLRSRSGPVTIERSVTAMQPARSGGKLFVRDESGSVFAAPLTLAGGQGQ